MVKEIEIKIYKIVYVCEKCKEKFTNKDKAEIHENYFCIDN